MLTSNVIVHVDLVLIDFFYIDVINVCPSPPPHSSKWVLQGKDNQKDESSPIFIY